MKKLTELIIDESDFTFYMIIDLLTFMPNIHTLTINSILIQKDDLLLIEKSENFQMVSKTNNIRNVTIQKEPIFDELKLLLNLCPQLQHLTMRYETGVVPLLRVLLSNNHPHLCSLSVKDSLLVATETLKDLIDSKKLLNEYSLKVMNDHYADIDIWW